MTDREALLRAVLANPDDDTPRLIYADHLDELGGDANVARARFIRLQIATHREMVETGGTNRFGELAEIDLLAARFAETWVAEFPEWAMPTENCWPRLDRLFDRGFVEFVFVNPALIDGSWSELFTLTPLHSLGVAFAPGVTAWQARTRRYPDAQDELLERFMGPETVGLRELWLDQCHLTEKWLRGFAKIGSLPELGTLRLGGPGLSVDGIVEILQSRHFPRLRRLDLMCDCQGGLPHEAVVEISRQCPAMHISSANNH